MTIHEAMAALNETHRPQIEIANSAVRRHTAALITLKNAEVERDEAREAATEESRKLALYRIDRALLEHMALGLCAETMTVGSHFNCKDKKCPNKTKGTCAYCGAFYCGIHVGKSRGGYAKHRCQAVKEFAKRVGLGPEVTA